MWYYFNDEDVVEAHDYGFLMAVVVMSSISRSTVPQYFAIVQPFDHEGLCQLLCPLSVCRCGSRETLWYFSCGLS